MSENLYRARAERGGVQIGTWLTMIWTLAMLTLLKAAGLDFRPGRHGACAGLDGDRGRHSWKRFRVGRAGPLPGYRRLCWLRAAARCGHAGADDGGSFVVGSGAMRSTVAVAALVLAIASAGAQAPAGPAGTPLQPIGPAPYLAPVAELKFKGFPQEPHTAVATQAPRPGTIGPEVWEDVPFGVVVPFDVRTEGEVRISPALAVHWDESDLSFLAQTGFFVSTVGIYRLDGQPVGAAVEWGRKGGPGRSTPPGLADFRLEAGAIPVWLAEMNNLRSFANTPACPPEAVEHVPFGKSPEPCLFGTSIRIAGATPGTYALWIALNGTTIRSWPMPAGKRDRLRGALRVDVIVAKGNLEPGDSEVEWLFGRGKDPWKDWAPGRRENFRAATFQIPFVLRRDGWIFHHAETVVWEPSLEAEPKVRAWSDGSCTGTRTFSPSASVSGQTAALSVMANTRASCRGKEATFADQYRWHVEFPAEIPDMGTGDVRVSGYVEGDTPSQQRAWVIQRWGWPWLLRPNPDLPKPVTVEQLQPGSPIRRPAGGGGFQELVGASGDDNETHVPLAGSWRRGNWASNPDMMPFWIDDRRPTVKGPGKGGNPFVYRYLGFSPSAERSRLFEKQQPYPLIAQRWGPWDVIAFYERRKDREPAAGGGGGAGTVTAEGADPFWAWYPGYSRDLKLKKEALDAARLEAGLAKTTLRSLEASKRRISEAVASLPPADEVREFPQGRGAMPPRKLPAIPEEMVRRMNERVRVQEDKMNAIRAELTGASNRARASAEEIVQALSSAYDRFGTRHPELLKWRKGAEELRDRLPLQLALLAGDPVQLKAAAEDAESRNLVAPARVLQAQAQLAQGDPVGALFALRDAVDKAPGNADAQRALAQLEAAFLKTALEKAHGAVQNARAAFYGYLAERGFNEKDGKPLPGWIEIALHPIDAIDSETKWAIFTTGLTGALSGIGDVEWTGFTAEHSVAAEKRRRAARTGRACARGGRERPGRRLSRAPDAHRAARARGRAPPRPDRPHDERGDAEGAAAPERDRRPLHRSAGAHPRRPGQESLHAARRQGAPLGQPRGSPDRDGQGLRPARRREHVARVVRRPLEPAEPPPARPPLEHRLGLGGSAGAGFWGATELELLAVARASGEVKTGLEVFATAARWDRAMKAFGKTEAGAALLDKLESVHRFERSLGFLDRATWTGGKLVAALLLQGGAYHFADKVVESKSLVLAFDALFLLTGDMELLRKWLRTSPVPPARLSQLIHKVYLPEARAVQARIEAALARKQIVRAMIEAQKKGATVPKAELEAIGDVLDRGWRERVPSGVASEDARIALDAAHDEALSGLDNGAVAAAEALADDAAREAAAIAQQIRNAESTAAQLEQIAAEGDARGPALEPADPPPPPGESAADAADERILPETIDPPHATPGAGAPETKPAPVAEGKPLSPGETKAPEGLPPLSSGETKVPGTGPNAPPPAGVTPPRPPVRVRARPTPPPPSPGARTRPDLNGDQLPPAPRPGSLSAQAEEALAAGRLEEAHELYDRAYRTVREDAALAAAELPPDELRRKVALAWAAKQAKRLSDPAASRPSRWRSRTLTSTFSSWRHGREPSRSTAPARAR